MRKHLAAVVFALALLPNTAVALMGDCGQPASGTAVKASSALAILRVAVKQTGCALFVCDVDNNGTITAADALRALRTAVGTATVNCPAEPAGTRTNCDLTSIRAKIDSLNSTVPPAGTFPLLTPETSILLNCSANATISADDATDNWTELRITQDFVSFGVDSGLNVTFELSPVCYNRCLGTCDGGQDNGKHCSQKSQCRGATSKCEVAGTGTATELISPRNCTAGCNGYGISKCSNGYTTSAGGQSGDVCPDTDTGDAFIALAAKSNRVSGFRVRGFSDGVHFEGTNGTALNLKLERQCDDSISNFNTGVGNVVQGGTLSKGCDKCAQDVTGPAINSGSCSDDDCYHITYRSVNFQGCKTGWRLSTGSNLGKFRMLSSTFSPGTTGFDCVYGMELGAAGLSAAITDNSIDDCDRGVLVGGAQSGAVYPTYDVTGNVITNGRRVGVWSFNQAIANLHENVIVGQGSCCGSATPNAGGVSVSDSGQANIVGKVVQNNVVIEAGNKICNNILTGPTYREVDEQRSDSYVVPAQNNWWCNTSGVHSPLGVFGSVDHANALAADPFPAVP